MQVNPYSTELRYTLGLMIYELHNLRPRSLRIATRSVEMAKSVVRYLWNEQVPIFVESVEIRDVIAESFGLTVQVVAQGAEPADAALFPFSLEEGVRPGGEMVILAACYNALSYKSLLYPRVARGTIFSKLACLKANYYLRPIAGLYAPKFLFWLILAKAVERLNSAWYFRLEDQAMRRLIDFGPMWRVSYIVVIAGQKTN